VAERVMVQSQNCGDDDARGGGAHQMAGTSVEAAIAGLLRPIWELERVLDSE